MKSNAFKKALKIRNILFPLFFILISLQVQSQTPFWSYDFSDGSLTPVIGTDNLTQVGTTMTTTADRFSADQEAITFNNDYLTGGTTGAGSYSVSFFIRNTVNDAVSRHLAHQFYDNYGYSIRVVNGTISAVARFGASVNNQPFFGSSTAYLSSTTMVDDGNWHHVVLTAYEYQESFSYKFDYKLYVDGVLQDSDTRLVDMFSGGNRQHEGLSSNSSVTLGVNPSDSSLQYNGDFDDFNFYKTALSATQVADIYNERSPQTIYVDKDATGNNDGSSWTDAFVELSSATNYADVIGDEVWIAEGTYTPDISSRSVRFNINAGVSIYGGFNGTETTLSQRDWKNNEVILSGDLLNNDNANIDYSEATRSDNSYNVVYVTGENTRIDGVTISGGHANHPSTNGYNRGAAIYKAGAVNTLDIHNCKIENNTANISAGIFAECTANAPHNINIQNSIIQNNESRYATAYIISFLAGTGNGFIANCLLADNTAKDLPSGQGLSGSAGFFDSRSGTTLNVELINCTIVNNTDNGTHSTITENTPIAVRRHGGTLNFTAANNIFDNNSAAQTFGRLNNPNCPSSATLNHNIRPDAASTWCGGTSSNEITTAPALDSNYRPTNASPGNNAGDNTVVVGTIDYDGNSRVINGTVDLGAFEYGCSGIPTNAAVNMTTPTNAVFSWDAVAGATFYQVKYRLKGTSAWTTTGTAYTQRNVPNLTTKKYYQFKVRAQCANGSWSDFTAIELFYTSTCDVPTGVASVYLDNTRMRIRWDVHPNEIKAKVRYREVGTSTWYTQNSQVGNNYIYINNLTPNATYQYRVRSNCNGNDWSAYTGSYFHDLSGSSLRLEPEETTMADTRIYPNPTRNVLNIEFETKDTEEVHIIISNNLGRNVHLISNSYDEGIQNESINVSSLSNGYYFITIRSRDKMETKKFMKID